MKYWVTYIPDSISSSLLDLAVSTKSEIVVACHVKALNTVHSNILAHLKSANGFNFKSFSLKKNVVRIIFCLTFPERMAGLRAGWFLSNGGTRGSGCHSARSSSSSSWVSRTSRDFTLLRLLLQTISALTLNSSIISHHFTRYRSTINCSMYSPRKRAQDYAQY